MHAFLRLACLDRDHAEGADRILRQLVQGRQHQRRLQETLQPMGLGEAELLVLWGLRNAGETRPGQGELAERLAISPPHLSGLVEQLRQAGRIECQRDASDRRRQLWRLTAKGNELLLQALQAIEREAASFLAADAPAAPPTAVPPLSLFSEGAPEGEAEGGRT